MVSRIFRTIRRSGQPLAELPRVFHLVGQASGYWTIAWGVLLVVQGLLPAATVTLTRTLVDALVLVTGQGLSQEAIAPVLRPALLMATVLLLTELVQGVISWVRTAQSELVQDYISGLIHRATAEADYAFFESSEFYDRLNRATSNASGQSLALLENVGSLVQNSITLLAMAALLLPYGWWLPLVLVVSTLPALGIILRFNRYSHRWWEETTLDRRRLQYYETILTHQMSAAELRLFDLGEHFQTAFRLVRRRLYREQMQITQKQGLTRLAAGLLALLFSGGAVLWIGYQVLLGVMTLGDLALFYQAFNRGQGVMRSLLGNMGQIHNNSLFLKNLFEFLALKPAIADPAQPVPAPEAIHEGICLRDITFRYPMSDRPILQQFNLTIPAGKVVAIVGDNGAGKSTLVKLLCRFYDPEVGSIELDGVDLRQFRLKDLRRLITVLFQAPIPYHASAAENIALGDIALAPTHDDLEIAAKAAGIHDRITRLPRGYDSQLGKGFPGGIDLSGGEWQRLALARAFLRRANLIILDEPTSALDPWAEADWLNRFRTLAQHRTALVITHRFTLAMQADMIHVMRSGEIVESGTHSELLARNGYYAESWRSQMEMGQSTEEHQKESSTVSGSLPSSSPPLTRTPSVNSL